MKLKSLTFALAVLAAPASATPHGRTLKTGHDEGYVGKGGSGMMAGGGMMGGSGMMGGMSKDGVMGKGGMMMGSKDPDDDCPTTDMMPCITKEEMIERMQSLSDAVPTVSEAYWAAGGGLPGSQSIEGCQVAYGMWKEFLAAAYNYPDQVIFKPSATSVAYTYRTTIQGFLSYALGTECLVMVGTPEEQFPPGNDGSMFFEYGFVLFNIRGGMGWTFPSIFDPDSFLFATSDDMYDGYCQAPMASGSWCFQPVGAEPSCLDTTFGFRRREDGTVVFAMNHASRLVPVDQSLTVCQDADPGPACE